MDETARQLAHMLGRLRFGVTGDDIDRHRHDDRHDLIDAHIADDGWALSEAEAAQRTDDEVEWDTLPTEWIDRMLDGDASLHERMTWFWHDHFTSHREETSHREIWRQHHRIRRHALGNIRTLAREMLTDGAMLHYLDGDGSRGDAPNENLSREFLELFMLGRNAGYGEADVKAGARILAGWWVDWDSGDVGFDPEGAYDRPVRFLGRRQRWTLDSYVDRILDQPSCAEHLAASIHRHLVSTELSAERRAQLGTVLRQNDWELRPLLEEMLHHDDFTTAAGVRTRQPVEWLTAAARVFGAESVEDIGFELWWLSGTGQVPFEPPNVAGWPDDDRWSSATQVMARMNLLLHWEVPERLINRLEPTTAAVLEHCALAPVSDTTRAALDAAIGNQTEYDRGLELLLTLAVTSPEFSTI